MWEEVGTAETVETQSGTQETPGTEEVREAVTSPKEQPSGSADSDESFIENFDPKSLEGKPELQAAYRQMQSAFTKKTQALAESRKKVSGVERQAQAYAAIMANPQLREQVVQVFSGKTLKKEQSPDNGNKPIEEMTDEEIRDYYTNHTKSEVRREFQPYLDAVTKSGLRGALAAVRADMGSKYDDFSEYEGDIMERLNQVNPQSGNSWGMDLFLEGNGQLEHAIAVTYKEMAFDNLRQKASEIAAKEIHAKKSANLGKTSSTSALTEEPAEFKRSDGKEATLLDKAQHFWETNKKKLGIANFDEL